MTWLRICFFLFLWNLIGGVSMVLAGKQEETTTPVRRFRQAILWLAIWGASAVAIAAWEWRGTP